ncbi:hypothetical protein PCL_13012 [Purpureocillium lilacinum]|uniref:Uncharacterized protein n=1 Tax=Purpureocillium lilacinum TaxID=33203 RepID=A0A2U3E7X9_PURLI|nr:hypothetical protein PCL_13012 [Purpureocillium lilacinum]
MQHLEPKSTAEQSVEDAAAKRTIANGATARSWGEEDKGLANRRRAQGKWTDELPVGRATAPDELEGGKWRRGEDKIAQRISEAWGGRKFGAKVVAGPTPPPHLTSGTAGGRAGTEHQGQPQRVRRWDARGPIEVQGLGGRQSMERLCRGAASVARQIFSSVGDGSNAAPRADGAKEGVCPQQGLGTGTCERGLRRREASLCCSH